MAIKPSLVDIVVEAARTTGNVYASNTRRLSRAGSSCSDSTLRVEMRRAVLMDELAKDENLCEMLAGRLRQFGART